MTSTDGYLRRWLGLTQRVSPSVALRPWRQAALSGLGGFSAIYLLAGSDWLLDAGLLIAPFGASCVLVFACPQSPFAQPRNVVAGHLISSVFGLLSLALLGDGPSGLAVGVGLAIAAMYLTETLHPPAGADPIVIVAAGSSWSFLFVPVVAGTLLIVASGVLFHRVLSGAQYPVRD